MTAIGGRDAASHFAQAILTTDTGIKVATRVLELAAGAAGIARRITSIWPGITMSSRVPWITSAGAVIRPTAPRDVAALDVAGA